MTMLELFEASRRGGAPLVAIRTVDPNAAIAELAPAVKRTMAAGKPTTLVMWDAARGLTALDKGGEDALRKLGPGVQNSFDFVQAMVLIAGIERTAVVFAHNVHRQIHSQEPGATAAAVQAVANLRDAFKENFRMLVCLGPVFETPRELEHDFVVFNHGLPGREQLSTIVNDLHTASKQPLPKPDKLAAQAEALSGLSTFAAETVGAMALTEHDSLNMDVLWERKRVTIEQARGLTVYRGGETFADIVGCDAVKEKLRRKIRSKSRMGCVVWIDEIDKALANVEGDTTGVRTDQMRVLLTEMDKNEWRGLVAVGMSGGGKSLLAKAVGNEAGVPTIELDLGGAESKYVGESEANMRHLIDVVKAVGGGNAYFIATSNAATVMRPELQRRFTDGMWMFDLMTSDERAACWKFYMKKYGLRAQTIPNDDGWTGAEIRNCCRSAWEEDVTLVEAAIFILPMSVGRAEEIERLRQFAQGRLLDASRPGHYVYDKAPMARATRAVLPGSERVQ